MEKYGFIYLWYDRKRKMYYVGSHWGSIDDGYICSSNRMRDAYRRRPTDFKRRIIQSNVSRETLLNEEHKWLSKIHDDELGKKYYNLRKHRWGHWSTDVNRRMTVGQKISEKHKGRKKSDSEIEKIRSFMKGKKQSLGYKHTEETLNRLKGPFSEERKNRMRGHKKTPRTEEHRKNMSLSQKGKPRDNSFKNIPVVIGGISYINIKTAAKILKKCPKTIKKLSSIEQ